MQILDRYILRMFFKAFVICFMSLAGLYIIIDSFGNLEEFINLGQHAGGLTAVLVEYYGARVLAFFDRTSAILTLMAAIFTVTWLQRHNEMTAMMAAGISKLRIVIPLIIAVAVINALAIGNRELLIPSVRGKLTRNAQDWTGNLRRDLHPRYDHETHILLKGRYTIARDQSIEAPNFRLPPAFSQFGKQLAAEYAYYSSSRNDRPGGYLLHGIQQPENLDKIPSALVKGRPVILSPHDTDWLKSDECFVVSRVSFLQLAGGKTWQQFSSTAELLADLRNPSLDYGANVRVTIHSRLVRPFLDMTLLFLGLPLVLSRKKRNIFVAIGFCLLLVHAFYIVVLASHGLGSQYVISPALSAWAPLMILVPIAVALSNPLRQ